MLSLVTLIFAISIGGLLCEEENCWKKVHDQCVGSLFPMDFPDSVEELKTNCRDIQTLGSCVLQVRENCSINSQELHLFRGVLKYISEACDEDSAVFQVISTNLGCVTPAARTIRDACDFHDMNEENRELLLSRVKTLIAESEHLNENEESISCLDSYAKLVCGSITVGLQCGPEAKSAVFDILAHTDYHYSFCSEEIRNELSALDAILEIALIEEQKLRNENETE